MEDPFVKYPFAACKNPDAVRLLEDTLPRDVCPVTVKRPLNVPVGAANVPVEDVKVREEEEMNPVAVL